ncbi:hypothetical protein FACS189450_12780 [Spirochaetia bacterium]|nr:hypothetical protein FACS189450_12780 [Spirochaetia bacterium]GHV50944.1 hypothetical protein AGMMS49579_05380 [Spirochaetia bacterium]
MGIITSTVRVGQKPTKEQLKQLKAIAKKPIHYTEDCPASTPEALQEFAALAVARRRNRQNPSPVIAIRIKPNVLEKYKALGKGYTSIMADVLDYAANNPEILTKAQV